MTEHGVPGRAEQIVDELEAKVLGDTPGYRAGDQDAGEEDVTPAIDQDLDVEQMSAGAEEGGATAPSD